MRDEDKIELILGWADDHPEFDPTFVEELASKLDTYGRLTPAQSQALDNIIERWRIDQ